jgi:multisubunit Na+/H+ antiporter MnhF subunit
MSLELLFTYVLYTALVVHIFLLGFCVWRVWDSDNVINRLIGFDAFNNLMLGLLVILAMIERENLFLDVALAMAALGFITLVALSKYLADEQMF